MLFLNCIAYGFIGGKAINGKNANKQVTSDKLYQTAYQVAIDAKHSPTLSPHVCALFSIFSLASRMRKRTSWRGQQSSNAIKLFIMSTE